MNTEPEHKEWAMPQAGLAYRILIDPAREDGERVATGIRRLSDGLPADISIEDDVELRALGWRTLRMPDEADQNVEVHTSATGSEDSTQVEGCSQAEKLNSQRVADCGATPCSASSFVVEVTPDWHHIPIDEKGRPIRNA